MTNWQLNTSGISDPRKVVNFIPQGVVDEIASLEVDPQKQRFCKHTKDLVLYKTCKHTNFVQDFCFANTWKSVYVFGSLKVSKSEIYTAGKNVFLRKTFAVSNMDHCRKRKKKLQTSPEEIIKLAAPYTVKASLGRPLFANARVFSSEVVILLPNKAKSKTVAYF